MDKLGRLDRMVMKYVSLAAVFILVIFNYQHIFAGLRELWDVISPVVYGFVFAYILNLIMVMYEGFWFPETDNELLIRARRPVSILLALITVIIVIVLVLWLIIPQLISLVQTLLENLPLMVEYIQRWIEDLEEIYPQIDTLINNLNINWENIARDAASFANNILGSTFTTFQLLTSSLFRLVVILVVAIYALLSKEKIQRQVKRVLRAYMKRDHFRRLKYVLRVTNESFSSFITGMLIEAIIYGTLVTVGMMIFNFPYAGMIGALSGALALVPMVGAILSAVIGTMLIFVQNPIQGLFFLLFNIVLQQLESNAIYPRIVGGSIGLPGIWTFIAVTIGGGLLGPAGFFLGVPIASVIYKLIRSNVEYKEHYYELDLESELTF
ncbi:AI-2E family transporter [Aerococcaceae bacterium INB8]|uniref:AI-2E family transporter n=1 Tax=Ruoffia halotolerans TaxID=2748684 RepID=A0A839A2X1_9LACT|nr:AI-2E family transporter [Ruoffia halotolerans]MBA5728210.1 AI-2E family transporter [Ruoffia halotolerans]